MRVEFVLDIMVPNTYSSRSVAWTTHCLDEVVGVNYFHQGFVGVVNCWCATMPLARAAAVVPGHSL